jgi:short-subunit dehydrogenase
MGRALARLMAERGDRVHLLGRNADELERSAADLTARGATVTSSHCDLTAPDNFGDAMQAANDALGGIETFVITAAQFATQDELEASPQRAGDLLTANFANTVALCEHARPYLMRKEGGTLCVFSSVAGDRPRSPMVIYGAAKAGLTAYLNGLDHRFRRRGLRTVCVKPGFVRTDMTADLDPPPFAGEPEAVARRVLRAIDRGTPVVYAPAIWRWVMFVIKRLPRAVMRRIGF